jgi:Tfp pilus assembly protein PilN
LELFPDGHRAAQRRTDRRRLYRFAALGLALWTAAGAIYMGRLHATYARATHQLDASRLLVDSALELRRDLDAGQATLQTLAQARRTRATHLRLLGSLTRGLPDSVTLIALHVGADRTVRLVGYAPRASQVVAELEQVQGLSGARLEGAVSRELVAGRGTLDRFSIVATELGQ